jgi:hypothetical protein
VNSSQIDIGLQDTGRSQDTGGLDPSGIPVSRRSSENAKSLLGSTTVEATFEYDGTGVGVIWRFYGFVLLLIS